METVSQNPCQWRLSTLLSLQTEELHQLASWAVGTITSFRLVLGRCLLALHENKGYKQYGCSTAVHYASARLGVNTRVARECKRVADRLQDLPRLTLAAERGEIAWTKLREIVRVAVPETEAYWLKLAQDYDSDRLQRLVSKTPPGQLPGDANMENACTTEFRIAASPELVQMFRRARRMFSLERDESLTGAETLECLLASFFSSQTLDPEVLEEMRVEADKDLQAEGARQLPEVMEAREQAARMGLLHASPPDPAQETKEAKEELLEQAIGTQLCHEACCSSERPGRVISVTPTGRWQNKKLRFNPISRHTTKAQKKEILRRDAWACRTPGCPNQTWLHIHHQKPYSKGGSTTPDNLICLCSGCHRNLHTGLLKIRPDDNGHLVFTDQSGRRLDKQADLELAAWLDFWTGWRGKPTDSHQMRVMSQEWSVFAS